MTTLKKTAQSTDIYPRKQRNAQKTMQKHTDIYPKAVFSSQEIIRWKIMNYDLIWYDELQ